MRYLIQHKIFTRPVGESDGSRVLAHDSTERLVLSNEIHSCNEWQYLYDVYEEIRDTRVGKDKLIINSHESHPVLFHGSYCKFRAF